MAATARQEREMKMKYAALKRQSDQSPVELLRAYCLANGVNGIKSLGRAFRFADENGDRKLDLREFDAALNRSGVQVDRELSRECFALIDKDASGTLDFDEFLVALRPPMNKFRLNLIGMAFRKLDKTGDGEITIDDLRGVYSAKKHPKYLNGEWSEDQVFKAFLDTFDSENKDGVVTREEFNEYYAGVSASIDSDTYFDLMMRQAWRL